jgi:hypothetical protein
VPAGGQAAAGGSWGVAFLVSAGSMAEFIAKACSSPQTVEINARSRAPTLMKWVNVGLIEGAGLALVAIVVDAQYRVPLLLGALAEGIITLAEYLHAKRAGLSSVQLGTETPLQPNYGSVRG